MKTRICFVGFGDDRPEALKSLKQAAGDAWDCTFVLDGPQALAAMAAQPFHAVVAYLYLTGMTGAELLRQVGQSHPRTLRFVLGDLADEEATLNSIGGPHQFIVQPCKPQALISTLQQSLDLNAKIFTDQFLTFAAQLQNWPSPPSTYFQIRKQTESNANLQNICEAIARDEAVNTRLLQMVNSPAFGFSDKIKDPGRVIALLGIEAVKSLVLCTRICSESEDAKRAGIPLDKFWEHSFRVASLAREITLTQTFDTHKANEAFAVGLLHNAGQIVLASNLPREYASVIAAARKHGRPLHEQEATQLGATHAQVAAYLLGRWGMPLALVEAVALHLNPTRSSAREFSPITAVHVANVFAYEKETSANDALPSPKLDNAHLDALVLKDKLDAWRRMLVSPAPDPACPPPVPKSSPPPVPAVAAAPKENNWLRWVLAPTTAVIVLGAVLWWSNRSRPDGIDAQARTQETATTHDAASSHSRHDADAPGSDTTSDSSADSAVVVADADHGFDSVKLQGIFYRATNPMVVINGQSLGVGESINGVEVISIGQTNATLGFGKERRIFLMK